MNYTLVLYVLAIVLVGAGASVYNYYSRMKTLRYRISKQFGYPVESGKRRADFEQIASYYKNRRKTKGSGFHIDDITWDDLSMDEIFLSMNNTQSSIGEEKLYELLRSPLFDEKELLRRDEMMEYFDSNEEERFQTQYNLGKLGKNSNARVSDYLYKNIGTEASNLGRYRVMSVLPIAFLLLAFVNVFFLFGTLAAMGVNFYISQSVKKDKSYKFDDFTYIVAMVQCGTRIAKLGLGCLKDRETQIQEALDKVKNIRNKVVNMEVSGTMNEGIIFSEYLRMFFLTEVVKYEKISKGIQNNGDALLQIYEYIGILDAMIAIASYRRTLDFYAKPKLWRSKPDSKESLKVEFEEIYHPLIDDPVTNSCSITKPMLLTGSNASGKSTFLKVIGINALTAQTIYTTFSESYESCFVRLFTSMALQDNLFNNESYFIVEIKSLKRIIDKLRPDIPCLCFIDEILRGTNTVERISASSEVLDYFSRSNCLCVAATHDVELTNILEQKFDNYHFEERIENNEITFDYQLRKGRAQSRNAIKLLGMMGYEEEIIARAEHRAEAFMETGDWEAIKA